MIINNSGNQTYNGTNTSAPSGTQGAATQQSYTTPKPLTPEQKLSRAERLAKEARESKKGAVKYLFIALLLFVFGILASGAAKNTEQFEKIKLSGTKNVGYATDEINGASGTRLTEEACEEFYEKIGVPLYFYTKEYYNGTDEEAYAEELYDKLFSDDNHILLVYCDNLDVWSYYSGDNVPTGIVNAEALLDHMENYWFDNISYDQVLAKSVTAYQKSLTGSSGNGAVAFSGILFIAGGVMVLVSVYTYVNKGKEAKRYEEEAKTLQAEILLSKPLETFGNQEVENLKDKYDNM